MDSVVVLAALLSAFLHAAWNAAVKASPDAQGAMAAVVVGSGLTAVPALAFLPWPSAAALPWLAASALFNLLAMLTLVQGYAHGGFGFVYPLARAVSPLLVTLFANVLVGESLSPTGIAGVALISAGVAFFAVGRGRHGPAAFAYALAAGLFSAAYAVCDAQGARLSPSVLGYALVLSIVNAVVFGTTFRLRGGSIRDALASNRAMAVFGAAAAILSYVLILWVWERAPIALGAALRDTSMVFGALIAVVVLRERMAPAQMGAVALVALGAGILRFA
ncbi:DMT family transporter [Microvirga lenta]|uniref:DMT family transporter n=1 Tax=Microvirga lenta TaxID=2881337 RepID=UPI001CFF78F5|nr:DMT family transporter [Microvirga lenta]MCB5174831.1 DMT family transporter [Microvirga lenta]